MVAENDAHTLRALERGRDRATWRRGARKGERSWPARNKKKGRPSTLTLSSTHQLDYDALAAELDLKSPLEIMDHVSLLCVGVDFVALILTVAFCEDLTPKTFLLTTLTH